MTVNPPIFIEIVYISAKYSEQYAEFGVIHFYFVWTGYHDDECLK